jgi:hypothetical protein
MVLTFVRLVPVDITRPATHALNAPFADRANTKKQEQRVMVAPLAIHNFVMLVQMVGHRILARRVNM